MKKICLLLLLFYIPAWAQLDLSLNGLVVSPQGQFQKNLDRVGFGFSLSGKYNFEPSPFSLGLNLGYALYGSETRSEILIWPVSVDVTTDNNIFFMHMLGSVHQNFGIFQPYAEVLAGFQVLWTDTKITDQEPNDNEDPIASSTHLSDWTSSFGLGGGLKIKLTEFKTDEFGDDDNPAFLNSALYLDLKVMYIFGGQAEYLREGDIEQGPNNAIILHKSHSETDYITYHIGVTFHLFNK
jgi:hypothetical protein